MAFVLDGEPEATVEHYQTERALDLMRSYVRSDRPFFLTLQFWGPHEQVRPVRKYADLYPAARIPLVPAYDDALEGRPRQYRRHRDEFECWYYGSSKLTPDQWREVTAKYYAYTTQIDDQVARMLAELDRLGLADNTLVLFTADHGNLCGSRGGLFDKGVAMFEDTYHIPFLVRWPGVAKPGTRCAGLISNMDIFSTLLDAAGAAIPAGVDSHSILPLLNDTQAGWREELMSWSSGVYYLHSQRMLRWEHYKYVFTPYDIDELYDLRSDPDERRNRIDDALLAEVRTELRRRLIRCAEAAGDPLSAVMHGYFRL